MNEGKGASESDEQWTCGKGLAEHARVPAKMAEFLESLAGNLRAHVPTIDKRDPKGQVERDAYIRLSTEFESVAAHLADTATRMRDYRNLPAAPHHEEALADPGLVEIFERFVELEKELADLLAASVEQDAQQLEGPRAPDG